MGFSVHYQTTEMISRGLQAEIVVAIDDLRRGRTWLSCEIPFLSDDQGYMSGSSKPNFMPAAIDVAAAAKEGLPDGTLLDLLDILCALSNQFDIDWEISHDHSDGPLGYVRQGRCDDEVRVQCEGIQEMAQDIADEIDPDDIDSGDY